MITPSFGLTANERVLPKLALDFTTASLDSRITFTRTTDATHPATYINSSGYITTATNDQPRFDYDPITLQCKGLLIEESRQNTFRNDEAYIANSGVSRSSDLTNSPEGIANCHLMIENNAYGNHLIYNTVNYSFDMGVSYVFSYYVKPKGRFRFKLGSISSLRCPIATFDTSTGVVSGSGGTTGSIETLSNGWYRLIAIRTAPSTGTDLVSLVLLSNGGEEAYTGDNVSGAYYYGGQLEVGAFPTSYIPTTTTALTRNADVAVMTGTNFSDWFNASEGTFVLGAMIASNADFKYLFAASTGAASNIIAGRRFAGGVLADYVATGGSEVVDQAVTGTMTVNVPFNYAVGYKTNNVGHALNGGAIKTDTSAAIPTGLNILNIGARNSGFDPWGGWISSLRYFPQRLTDNEIVAFSK